MSLFVLYFMDDDCVFIGWFTSREHSNSSGEVSINDGSGDGPYVELDHELFIGPYAYNTVCPDVSFCMVYYDCLLIGCFAS